MVLPDTLLERGGDPLQPVGSDQPVRSVRSGQKDAAFLERLSDACDHEAGREEAALQAEALGNRVVAVLHPAAREHQRT